MGCICLVCGRWTVSVNDSSSEGFYQSNTSCHLVSSWQASCASLPWSTWTEVVALQVNPSLRHSTSDHPLTEKLDLLTSPYDLENYALVCLWAAVENHVGICAACAGAIKQKSISTLKRVRRSYSGVRSKSYRSSQTPTSTVPRTQDTEDRALYERSDSLPHPLSSHGSKSPGMNYELHEVPESPTKMVEYQLSTSPRLDV